MLLMLLHDFMTVNFPPETLSQKVEVATAEETHRYIVLGSHVISHRIQECVLQYIYIAQNPKPKP